MNLPVRARTGCSSATAQLARPAGYEQRSARAERLVKRTRWMLGLLDSARKFVGERGVLMPRGETGTTMTSYPVAKVCPSCRGTSWKRARAKTGVAFASDRICRACGTRYTPPTPSWARLVFALAGLLLALVGLFLIWVGREGKGEGMVLGLLPAIMGISAIVHSVRTFYRGR